MNVPADHVYSWTFDRRSPLIRVYLWLWCGSPNEITFCKLFWATVFAPFALLVRGLFAIVSPFFNRVVDRVEAKSAIRAARPVAAPADTTRKGMQGLLARIAAGFDKIASWAQAHRSPFKAIGTTLAFALPATLLSWVGYLLDNAATVTWVRIAEGVGITIVAVAAIALFVTLMVLKEDRVEAFFKAVGRFLKAGYYSVKYRTCPRVTIKD